MTRAIPGQPTTGAARLLAQTEREARRQLNLSPQWINAVMGAVILVAYGSLWLSTRGQHPYLVGPRHADRREGLLSLGSIAIGLRHQAPPFQVGR